MRLVRNGSVHPFPLLRREVSNFLQGVSRMPGVRMEFPALNIWDEGEAIHVEAELPGLKLEDLEITLLGNELTLSGEYRHSASENTTYHRRERNVGSFNRVLQLPSEVNAEKVEAKLTAGVLSLTLPKAEAAKPHKINVAQG